MHENIGILLSLVLILTGFYILLIAIILSPSFKRAGMIEPFVHKMVFMLHDALPVAWFIAFGIVLQQVLTVILFKHQ